MSSNQDQDGCGCLVVRGCLAISAVIILVAIACAAGVGWKLITWAWS